MNPSASAGVDAYHALVPAGVVEDLGQKCSHDVALGVPLVTVDAKGVLEVGRVVLFHGLH